MRTLRVLAAAFLVGCSTGAPRELAWTPVLVDGRASAQPSRDAKPLILDHLELPPVRPTARPVVVVPEPSVRVAWRGDVPEAGNARVRRGIASRMGAGFGRSYLALPEGPGHRVRICAKRCLTMTSTDAGPDKAMQRAGRVADMNDWAWAYVTGLPLSRGLATVTVTYL